MTAIRLPDPDTKNERHVDECLKQFDNMCLALEFWGFDRPRAKAVLMVAMLRFLGQDARRNADPEEAHRHLAELLADYMGIEAVPPRARPLSVRSGVRAQPRLAHVLMFVGAVALVYLAIALAFFEVLA